MAEKERIENMLTRLSTYYEDISAISKDAKDHPRKPEQHYTTRPVKTEKKKGPKKESAGAGGVKVDVASSGTTEPPKAGDQERRSSIPSKERRKSLASEMSGS